MPKVYRKTASKRRRRREHGGVPELAAQISGRSLSMVYKVRNGDCEVCGRPAGHRGSRTATRAGEGTGGMSGSLVSVESGQIRVLPSFADMLIVGRLGGRFAGASRRWVWPATHRNAVLLSKRLRQPRTTPEFDALLVPPEPQPEAEAPAAPAEPLPAFLPMKPPAEPEVPVPDGMLTRPWRHQKTAFKFCIEHFRAGLRGILLAMGMGTGKSLVACMLVLLAHGAAHARSVCPLRVVPVWVTQFERHVGIPLIIVALDEEYSSVAKKQEEAAEKMKLAQVLGQPFIVVVNYDSAWRDPFASWAEKVQWDLVIADEAHRIKTPGGKASLFFKRLRLHATTASRSPARRCRTARWTYTRSSGSWT